MSANEPGEDTPDPDVGPQLRYKIHVAGAIGLLQLLSENANRVITGDQSYIQDQLPPKDYIPLLESTVAKIIELAPTLEQ